MNRGPAPNSAEWHSDGILVSDARRRPVGAKDSPPPSAGSRTERRATRLIAIVPQFPLPNPSWTPSGPGAGRKPTLTFGADGRESNLRPTDYESVALPTELLRQAWELWFCARWRGNRAGWTCCIARDDERHDLLLSRILGFVRFHRRPRVFGAGVATMSFFRRSSNFPICCAMFCAGNGPGLRAHSGPGTNVIAATTDPCLGRPCRQPPSSRTRLRDHIGDGCGSDPGLGLRSGIFRRRGKVPRAHRSAHPHHLFPYILCMSLVALAGGCSIPGCFSCPPLRRSCSIWRLSPLLAAPGTDPSTRSCPDWAVVVSQRHIANWRSRSHALRRIRMLPRPVWLGVPLGAILESDVS